MSQAEQIMYIEDDPVLASVTMRSLARRGYGIAHFPSITAVRETCRPQDYDWALLDLKLEDGSSLELIEDILQQQPQMKVVVLTGYASIATAVQAIKLGAVNYLAKPATIEQILNAFSENNLSANNDLGDSLPLRRMEWEHIQQALADNNGNISATARQLKMHRRTLQRKLGKKPVTE
ncbi:MAG: response regulator [Cellvibrionaceae bacterium]|nr:response regulator [Cellvibrionaceae bacterium]